MKPVSQAKLENRSVRLLIRFTRKTMAVVSL